MTMHLFVNLSWSENNVIYWWPEPWWQEWRWPLKQLLLWSLQRCSDWIQSNHIEWSVRPIVSIRLLSLLQSITFSSSHSFFDLPSENSKDPRFPYNSLRKLMVCGEKPMVSEEKPMVLRSKDLLLGFAKMHPIKKSSTKFVTPSKWWVHQRIIMWYHYYMILTYRIHFEILLNKLFTNEFWWYEIAMKIINYKFFESYSLNNLYHKKTICMFDCY